MRIVEMKRGEKAWEWECRERKVFGNERRRKMEGGQHQMSIVNF
jgi:hypothetical protein